MRKPVTERALQPRRHMARTKSLPNALVRTAAILATVASLALGGLAATTLLGSNGADQVVAVGQGSVGGADSQHDGPTTVPAGSADVPAPKPPEAGVTPGRNPPLMAEGASSDLVRELQVRLAHLDLFDATVTGYFGSVTASSVSAYQTAKGQEVTGEVYPDLWTLLQSETPVPTQEEMYPPPPEVDPPAVDPGSLDARCLTGRVLCIDKTDRELRWVVNGRVVMEMDARFGGSATPTREGQFSVYWKDRDHVSSIFESQMPFAMFFSGGQAVHYSSDFAGVGYDGASHGCVNIRDRDGLEWLFDQVNVGDKVVVYWS
jgi:lipoprotein-anchoring transpeptidase ErfK/SrfK